MPAGTYTYTLYTITGSANNTFTVTGSFTVTVFDSDDNFGVGDDQTAGGGTTETGAAPVIQSLGAGAPAGWTVGDTFYFGGARGLDNDGTDDVYIPKVAGAWQTTDALFSVPGASVPLVVGQTYTRTTATNVDTETLPCFTAGTHIVTPQGERLVEELRIGDCIITADNGLQPIRWIGSSTRLATKNLAPILIRKGALGNARDLMVSPQHRMLISDWRAELLFGEHEVLVPAKSLLSDQTIIRKTGGMVTYHHIMFDQHEIIYAEGIPTESYHPDDKTLSGFNAETRGEILDLFPELKKNGISSYGSTARPCLKHSEGKILAQLSAL